MEAKLLHNFEPAIRNNPGSISCKAKKLKRNKRVKMSAGKQRKTYNYENEKYRAKNFIIPNDAYK